MVAAILEKLLSYLNKNVPKDKQPYEALEGNTIDSENTLYLLSQLEKALASPDNESLLESQPFSEPDTSESQTDTSPKRIMIIDDSPGMLKAIKEQLGSDYEVIYYDSL